MEVGNTVEVISCDGLPTQDFLGKTGVISDIRPQIDYEIAVAIRGHKYNACFKRGELKTVSASAPS